MSDLSQARPDRAPNSRPQYAERPFDANAKHDEQSLRLKIQQSNTALGLDFDPQAVAASLFKAVKGAGTDEKTVLSEIRKITTGHQLKGVCKAFKEMARTNLEKRLREDFSWVSVFLDPGSTQQAVLKELHKPEAREHRYYTDVTEADPQTRKIGKVLLGTVNLTNELRFLLDDNGYVPGKPAIVSKFSALRSRLSASAEVTEDPAVSAALSDLKPFLELGRDNVSFWTDRLTKRHTIGFNRAALQLELAVRSYISSRGGVWHAQD